MDHVGRLGNAAASGALYDRCRAAGAGGDGRAAVTAAEATARRGMCGGGEGRTGHVHARRAAALDEVPSP